MPVPFRYMQYMQYIFFVLCGPNQKKIYKKSSVLSFHCFSSKQPRSDPRVAPPFFIAARDESKVILESPRRGEALRAMFWIHKF